MSPRKKSDFEALRAKSIDTIKNAALELFAKKGFANTSISMIAKEAKVSKGLLYNYFESKDALLESIIMDGMEMANEYTTKFLTMDGSPEKQFHGVLDSMFELLISNTHYMELMMALSFQVDSLTQFESLIKSKANEQIELIAHLFEQMGYEEPELEAHLFAAAADGVAMHYIHMKDDYPLLRMKDYLFKQFYKPAKNKL